MVFLEGNIAATNFRIFFERGSFIVQLFMHAFSQGERYINTLQQSGHFEPKRYKQQNDFNYFIINASLHF